MADALGGADDEFRVWRRSDRWGDKVLVQFYAEKSPILICIFQLCRWAIRSGNSNRLTTRIVDQLAPLRLVTEDRPRAMPNPAGHRLAVRSHSIAHVVFSFRVRTIAEAAGGTGIEWKTPKILYFSPLSQSPADFAASPFAFGSELPRAVGWRRVRDFPTGATRAVGVGHRPPRAFSTTSHPYDGGA